MVTPGIVVAAVMAPAVMPDVPPWPRSGWPGQHQHVLAHHHRLVCHAAAGVAGCGGLEADAGRARSHGEQPEVKFNYIINMAQ